MKERRMIESENDYILVFHHSSRARCRDVTFSTIVTTPIYDHRMRELCSTENFKNKITSFVMRPHQKK